ncbi:MULTISPECIES: hypothetical protein [unclassified Frankia]|uniref:hypothetical protein n=1 Tax=unclassified Frankia TaxID=2632575 RepID=UPI002AD2B349|nr:MULTISPECIES: hypothetical protein [unclassified Frankia]
MAELRKILVITDVDGRVIAAGHRGESSAEGLNLAIGPLPGQMFHEVEVPEPVTRLSGHDFHLILSRARLDPATARLTLPRIQVERHDQAE